MGFIDDVAECYWSQSDCDGYWWCERCQEEVSEMPRRQRVELELPEPREESGLPSGLLMYKPGTGEVYRLTNTGAMGGGWHTFELASFGGHRFNQPTAQKAAEGLVACPVGTVVRIVVEEE